MRDGASYVPPYHPALMQDLETETVRVHMLLGELRSLTKWPLELLCTHLGCVPEAKPPGIPTDQLMQHSVAYLSWVTELCNLVDRPEDRHDLLFGAFEMTAGAGGELHDRVARCRRACRTEVGGQTATELIKLGEVQRAWRLATSALQAGSGVPVRLSSSLDELTPHLHPRRLRWLYAPAPTPVDMLGPTVARRMRNHLDQCTRCQAAARELGLDLSKAAAA